MAKNEADGCQLAARRQLGANFRLYYFLGSLGRNVKSLARVLFRIAVRVMTPGDRLLLAIDDTPTKR